MSGLDLTLLYLAAPVLGVAIAPQTLGLALGQDAGPVKRLAEYGVVFLMFVSGLEFNLNKLRAMRRLVFGLGFSQVALAAGAG